MDTTKSLFVCNHLVLVVAMVAILIMLSARTKNSSSYIRRASHSDVIRGTLVDMVYMVAIARCFGVLHALN